MAGWRLQVLVALSSASNGATSAQALRATVPKERVVGLVRDLRGITTATNNKKTYGMQPALWPACALASLQDALPPCLTTSNVGISSTGAVLVQLHPGREGQSGMLDTRECPCDDRFEGLCGARSEVLSPAVPQASCLTGCTPTTSKRCAAAWRPGRTSRR